MVSIVNGETGLSVRTKLNTLFSQQEALDALFSSQMQSAGTRTELVADIAATATAGTVWDDGTVFSDGTVFYKYEAGATAISDLPGLVPFCPVGWCSASPEHFQQYTTGDMTAGVQAAIDYCEATFGSGVFGQGAVVGLLARDYTVADDNADGFILTIQRSVSLLGQGENSSRIVMTDATDVTLRVGRPTADIEGAGGLTETVLGVLIQDVQFTNGIGSAPTAGSHIRADRSVVTVNRCHMINHYRGVEILGSPESCKITDCQITQGGNNGATGFAVQALSSGIAVLGRLVPESWGAAVGYVDNMTLAYDAQSANFTVGLTVTGGTSGATAVIIADADAGTTGTLTLRSTNDLDFVDGETITDSSTGSATTNGANSARAYYLEPNSVYISNNNIRVGALTTQNGGDYAIFTDAVDGLYITNNHIAWGTTACIGIHPRSSSISLTNVTIVGGLIDPLPGKSQYGILISDRYGVTSNVMGSISVSGASLAGCELDGVSISTQCRRFQYNGGEIKGCGRYGVQISSLSAVDTLINGVHIYQTGTSTANAAAVYLVSGQRTTISNCKFGEYDRGIQVAAAAQRTSILGNSFADTGDVSILLATGCDIKACAGNDISEDVDEIPSATALGLPIGADVFRVTGTTTIATIGNATGAAPYDGREVTLIFAAALSITNAGTAGSVDSGGTITTAANDTLKLVYNATADRWLKIAFSAN